MSWIEVKVITTPEAAEAVSEAMYQMQANGLYIEDPNDILQNKENAEMWDYVDESLTNLNKNEVIIRAYLPEFVGNRSQLYYTREVAELKERLKTISRYLDIGKGEVDVFEVFDEDWANSWKKYYKTTKIGKNIVVKPIWESYIPRNRREIIVQIDPGMAFGTGTHQTTSMSIQLIEKHVTRFSKVLDIGCGSGILGITAIKLGARSCHSVDIDESALKVTNKNAEINNVCNKVKIEKSDLLENISEKYSIIVANITADIINKLLDTVSLNLKRRGKLIVSGIIKDRYEEVKDKLLAKGFKIVDEIHMDEWVALAVKRS